ncbi:MAG: fimbrillin family protein, partial [Bacteroidales bacterium]|nr:fimbrillin family protein [Bacteroidales bacterium]
MKKTNLILIALMALIFVSCSEDETTMSMPKDNAIEFGTYLGRDAQTRASVLTTKTMATDGFGVFAYYTDQVKWDEYSSKGTANFMDNLKVTSKTNGATWTYSPIKYWPNNDGAMVTFLAYAPWVEGKTITEEAKVNFKVENSIKAQTDLVWNTENHIDAKKDKLSGNVNFKFNHALARIGLKLEAAVDKVDAGGRLDKNTTITVNSVTLGSTLKDSIEVKQFYTGGTLDLTKTTAVWDPVEGMQAFVFNTTNGNLQNNVIKGASHINAKQLNTDDSYLMV